MFICHVKSYIYTYIFKSSTILLQLEAFKYELSQLKQQLFLFVLKKSPPFMHEGSCVCVVYMVFSLLWLPVHTYGACDPFMWLWALNYNVGPTALESCCVVMMWFLSMQTGSYVVWPPLLYGHNFAPLAAVVVGAFHSKMIPTATPFRRTSPILAPVQFTSCGPTVTL